MSSIDKQKVNTSKKRLGRGLGSLLSTDMHDFEDSPTPKKELVRNIIESKRYNQNDVILIGDSINDYEASIANNICFYGYNNTELITSSVVYIEKFKEFKFE